MDQMLVAWARGVKARARGRAAGAPALWLFTDTRRLPDPVAAAKHLPRGLVGIVLRDEARADRRALARALARVCRMRRLRLSVAGDWRLAAALGAAVHLRAGRRPPGMPRWLPVATSSAHGVADLLRARRAGAGLVFLSPVFVTASHPGAAALGPLRWGLASRRAATRGALGGLDGRSIRRLPRWCGAAGAIGALAITASDPT